MSWWTPIALKAVDLGFDAVERAVDWYEARQRKQRLASEWANAPAGVRGCPRCNEIVYTPFRDTCTKCGATLDE